MRFKSLNTVYIQYLCINGELSISALDKQNKTAVF